MRRKYFGLALAAVATLGPVQAFGGDREIAQAIIERLKVSRDAGELKNFNLDMKVDDGVVLFRGKVNGPEQHAVVLATSKGIEGVQNVVDELKIESISTPETVQLAQAKPAKIYRPQANATETKSTEDSSTENLTTPSNDDAFDFASALTTKSDAAAAKAAAKPVAIEVATPAIPAMLASAPVAQLNPHIGKAPTSQAADRRVQEVVPGIVMPTAAYEGSPEPAPAAAVLTDEQLTQSVIRAIGRAKAEGHVSNFGIDVNAYDGMIELEGQAASAQQREFLANIARHAPGARGVRNLIEVGQSVPTPAQTVAHRVPSGGLQPLPQGNQPRMSALPQQNAMQRGVPARTASYGGGQQMINGEMVVPGSIVNHGSSYMGSSMGGQVAGAPMMGTPVPMAPSAPAGAPRYDSPNLPNYAWPGYAAYPNYAALSYPQQYSPSAFPYIGPFYPYPQVPLGWRKVSLEWDDGWWFLDFTDK